jgi:UPF0755 protein
VKRALLAVAALALCAALAVANAAAGLRTAADPNAGPRTFWLEPGEPLVRVADRLERQGFLPKRALFGPDVLVAYATLMGKDRELKSGEYDLSPALTPLEILDKLVQGAVKMHEVTLPEGLRLDEIAVRLAEVGITDDTAFLELANDPALAKRLGVPADTIEGYAFPETYRFRRHTPPEQVIERMVGELHGRLTEADRVAISGSGFTLHQVVTLASIVEKETGQKHERPIIAAVYRNRLNIGMRLQSDPTVIYGLLRTTGFDGDIRTRDLRGDTPWNTYTRAGLPPGPIASPSIEAIRAVLAPADVPYLYFVSRNDGSHVFSTTLTEHNQAVKRFQSRRRSDVARSDDGKRR